MRKAPSLSLSLLFLLRWLFFLSPLSSHHLYLSLPDYRSFHSFFPSPLSTSCRTPSRSHQRHGEQGSESRNWRRKRAAKVTKRKDKIFVRPPTLFSSSFFTAKPFSSPPPPPQSNNSSYLVSDGKRVDAEGSAAAGGDGDAAAGLL